MPPMERRRNRAESSRGTGWDQERDVPERERSGSAAAADQPEYGCTDQPAGTLRVLGRRSGAQAPEMFEFCELGLVVRTCSVSVVPTLTAVSGHRSSGDR